MSRKLKDFNASDIINLRVSGVMPVDIAQRFGVSVAYVYKVIKNSGVKVKNPRLVEFSDDQKSSIISAYESGIGVKGIAEKVGLSCCPKPIKDFLDSIYGKTRNRSEQQFARMANSTPEQIAKLTSAAHKAAKGRVATLEEMIARAKSKEGRVNRFSRYEAEIFEMLKANFDNVIPAKAIGIYNADFAIGKVTVEVFGGGWSYSDRARIDRYIDRAKKISEAGFHTIFIIISGKSSDFFDADNLVRAIKAASADPSTQSKYWVIWGDFNGASGLGCDLDHSAFIPPFVNVRDVTTGRYKRVFR